MQTRKNVAATCNICTEKFNKTSHLLIKCPYCEFEACRTCCRTYLLNETTPTCMNNECNREWTRNFMNTVFTQIFLTNEYKKHREDVLFDQERALLPATQPLVENEIQKERLSAKAVELKKQIDLLRKEMQEINIEYWRINNNPSAQSNERRSFVRACPDENCRGFLSSQWKCGICEKWACPNCHEIKGEERDIEHTCNPDNVATAELLARDTKCCPNCGTGIFKIDGCFAENVPIQLYNGDLKMSQDIRKGDVLVGPDGYFRTVVDIFSGEDELYEIQQTRVEIIEDQLSREFIMNYCNKTNHNACNCECNCDCDCNSIEYIDFSPMSYTVNGKHMLLLHSAHNMEIGITVEEYMECSETVKNNWFGIQQISNTMKKYTDIAIVPKGKGIYYGWRLLENNQFLLFDNTVVRNCDQMWCTDCHTAFSWRTGRIETHIHNPHYYEWMRRTNNGVIPRNPGDVPGCNARIVNNYTAREFNVGLNSKKSRGLHISDDLKKMNVVVTDLCQAIVHLRYVEIPRYRYNYVENNQQLRIRYMRNMISEANFKIQIQQHEKKHQKNLEIRNVLQLVHDTCSDIIFRFYDEFIKIGWERNQDMSILNEKDAIITYANECFAEISKTFKCKLIQFNDNLRIL
jgi:hypothetical protein